MPCRRLLASGHDRTYLLQLELGVVLDAEFDDKARRLPLLSACRPRRPRVRGVVVHVTQGG